MTESSINQRFKILLDLLEKGKQTAFADKVGITAVMVNLIINGKQKDISAEVLKKIVDAYPKVNLAYLVAGIGNPLKSDRRPEMENLVAEYKNDEKYYNDLLAVKAKQYNELLLECQELRKQITDLVRTNLELSRNLGSLLTPSKFQGDFNAIVIDLYPKEQVTHEVTLAV